MFQFTTNLCLAYNQLFLSEFLVSSNPKYEAKRLLMCLVGNIHRYIIGHYKPSVRIIDLVSQN